MAKKFTAYVEWCPETRLYVGTVPDVCGAHSQGASLDELRRNLKEVVQLCLEEGCQISKLPSCDRFTGSQTIEVTL